MRSGANKKFANLVMAAGFLLLLVGSFYSQGAADSFYVKVEVRGTLNFRDGKGYFVEAPSTAFPKESIEIWLDVSEDKLLVRRLQQMMGKNVVVRGQLDELPSNVTTPVPRRRIYIRRFEIELAQSLYPQSWFAPINDPNKPVWEILPQEARPGEVILSKRNELGLLSNFAPTPFTYRGKRYASLEGFWQMMLYPDGPDDPRSKSTDVEWKYTREQVAQMTAFEAKAAGSLAEENILDMIFSIPDRIDDSRCEFREAARKSRVRYAGDRLAEIDTYFLPIGVRRLRQENFAPCIDGQRAIGSVKLDSVFVFRKLGHRYRDHSSRVLDELAFLES